MTNKQRILLLVLLGIIAATLLYPPMHVVSLYGDRALGRHWIFDRPYDIARIDFGALFVEWIFIGITIGAFYIASPFLEKYKQRIYLVAIPTIRIIRICIAFLMFLVVLSILGNVFFPGKLSTNNGELDMAGYFAPILMSGVVLALLITLFFGLRRMINFFHVGLYGTPHPNIVKRWDI